MIVPTIGRVVWFWPAKEADAPRVHQPYAALVVYVHGDRCVNLSVFDANGIQRSETSVALVQDDDMPSVYGHYAEWMPFQKGQAAKTEALEKAASA